MAERWFQVRITYYYAQGVGYVGHRLQLGHGGLRRATHVVDVHGAALAHFVTVAQIGGEVEYMARRYRFFFVEQIYAFRHLWYQRQANVD